MDIHVHIQYRKCLGYKLWIRVGHLLNNQSSEKEKQRTCPRIDSTHSTQRLVNIYIYIIYSPSVTSKKVHEINKKKTTTENLYSYIYVCIYIIEPDRSEEAIANLDIYLLLFDSHSLFWY